jgi:hypothetical protein
MLGALDLGITNDGERAANGNDTAEPTIKPKIPTPHARPQGSGRLRCLEGLKLNSSCSKRMSDMGLGCVKTLFQLALTQD